MFTGYQAPHTLGRIILDKSKDIIKIYGEPYEMNAKVCKLQSSSGHADQQQLLEWAIEMNKIGDLKNVALVHCEMDGAEPFKKLLLENGIAKATIPARGDTIELV